MNKGRTNNWKKLTEGTEILSFKVAEYLVEFFCRQQYVMPLSNMIFFK